MGQVTATYSLTTTFQKKIERPTRVASVTPKLVFFVLAWTAVQQQGFANLVLFHDKLDIFHRLQILKVLKTKLVPDLGLKVGIICISTS